MKQIPGTIIVAFHAEIAESTIEEYLEQEGLFGTKVSNFSNRYAVEVPAGHEEEYRMKLESCPLAKSVNPFFLKGMQERPRKKREEEG